MANAPYAPVGGGDASAAPAPTARPTATGGASSGGVARGVHLTNTSVNRALAGGAADALCANPLLLASDVLGRFRAPAHGGGGGAAGDGDDDGRSERPPPVLGAAARARIWGQVAAIVARASSVAYEAAIGGGGGGGVGDDGRDRWARLPASCLKVVGFDVLVDAEHRAWLLEANASPDMHQRCARRARTKQAVVRGALALAAGAGEHADGEDAALRRYKRVL